MTNYNKYSVEELEALISTLDTLYYQGEDCVNPNNGETVSDAEYDQIRKILFQKNPKSPIFKDTSAVSDKVLRSKKVKHNPPMTSISKAIGTLTERNDTLADFLEKCMTELKYDNKATKNKDGTPYFVQSFKHDGVAIALYYKDGVLVSAGLRPRDGINGEDVLENAKYVQGIPEKLPLPITCSIRGELECKISIFNKMNKDAKEKNEQVFANPRNYTTGSIRQLSDPKITGQRQISFTAYSIENLEKPPYKTAMERAIWCNKTLKVPFVRVEAFDYKQLKKMEDMVPSLDYEVDGVVIEVNNIEDAEQMGRHGDAVNGNPKAKLAWKFSEQSAKATVKAVRWQTGRTGKITPIIEFDGIQLDGTTVRQCMAHNVGIVKSKRIGVGAVVSIIKSGKIIPKIIDVVSPAKTVEIPTQCPECGSKLVIEQTGGSDASELFCKNSASCPAQNVGTLVHYLTTIGVKGLSDSVVSQLVEGNLVKRTSDFYSLTYNDLIGIGITERTALLTIARIWMVDAPEKLEDDEIKNVKRNKIKMPLQTFIQALGITGAGKGTGRTLASHFKGDLDAIMKAKVDDLKDVQDIGEKTAELLVAYFSDKKNIDNIEALLKHIEVEKPKTGKFSGMTFVFTGTVKNGKEYWYKIVEDLGGKIGSSVSKKTTFAVIGSDAGSKEQKAIELGIKRISIEELEKMI